MGNRLALALSLALAAAATAEPLRVLAIGDSLTEEYAFEITFSAPASSPFAANTRNWLELLADRRPDHVSFGSYTSSWFGYPDLRRGGYQYNYGMPGATTVDWLGYLSSAAGLSTRIALERHLGEVDAVVIFLGGNDLKSDYSGIFHDAEPPALLAQTVENLATLHDFVRVRKPALPIIIATLPDIGATPEVSGKYTDPAKRERARQRIAGTNAALAAMAELRGATVARIDRLTDRLFDEHPFHLNGTELLYPPDPENGVRRLFCRDGFHPATAAQALIADTLVKALNNATGAAIPRLENREILAEVLGLDPDQPYLDWAGPLPMTSDDDGDGVPALAEYALGRDPAVADRDPQFDDGAFIFRPLPDRLRFAELRVEESADLTEWSDLPAPRLAIGDDGSWRVLPGDAGRAFYRLAVRPRP